MGQKESAVQQKEMNGDSAVGLLSAPHQPNHLERGKGIFTQRTDDQSRREAPIVTLAHTPPLPEGQRLLIMGDRHSNACEREDLLLRPEEEFILFFP